MKDQNQITLATSGTVLAKLNEERAPLVEQQAKASEAGDERRAKLLGFDIRDLDRKIARQQARELLIPARMKAENEAKVSGEELNAARAHFNKVSKAATAIGEQLKAAIAVAEAAKDAHADSLVAQALGEPFTEVDPMPLVVAAESLAGAVDGVQTKLKTAENDLLAKRKLNTEARHRVEVVDMKEAELDTLDALDALIPHMHRHALLKKHLLGWSSWSAPDLAIELATYERTSNAKAMLIEEMQAAAELLPL